MRKLIYALIIWIIVFFLHFFGMKNGWYVAISFYDVIVHGLGGLGIGYLLLFVAQKVLPTYISFWKVFLFVLFSSLFIGLVWEIFEYVYDIAVIPREDYVTDTLMDLFMDMFGSLTAVFLYLKNK